MDHLIYTEWPMVSGDNARCGTVSGMRGSRVLIIADKASPLIDCTAQTLRKSVRNDCRDLIPIFRRGDRTMVSIKVVGVLDHSLCGPLIKKGLGKLFDINPWKIRLSVGRSEKGHRLSINLSSR